MFIILVLNIIDTSNIIDIHKYLMKKHDIMLGIIQKNVYCIIK